MASDRSRISYDAGQQYRSVVMQQGRVVTDPDLNEAQAILAEETRHEALDFVGPSGTPDDGYAVSVPVGVTNSDFFISRGTMYVGGVRVSISDAFYRQQPDWIAPAATEPKSFPAKELVWLELTEQEVSDLEDPDLREVALGGPDTAHRTRIVQRIRRSPLPATVTACSDALDAQIAAWAAEGRSFDPLSGALSSPSFLTVGFAAAAGATSPCEPVASGGFLGAENQLIRVRVVDQTHFAWSFDNASFLYRVDRVERVNNGTNNVDRLVLTTLPVDEQHHPRQSQMVELLRPTTLLANGGFVTEPFGRMVAMSLPFDADRQALTLDAVLPPGYDTPVTAGQPLFVRIWDEVLPFLRDKPVALGGTGIEVTLTRRSGVFPEGDFWTFAVRPGAATTVYPARYATGLQRPEGPRRWACSLAMVDWRSATNVVVNDCRRTFETLVELSKREEPKKCCSIIISPGDLVNGSFRTILDSARNVRGFKVCLLPGVYQLREPIVLTAEHSGLEFEACRDGVTIAGGNDAAFTDGLVQIEGATGVTFRGIQFSILVLPARGSTAAPRTFDIETLPLLETFRIGGGGISGLDLNFNVFFPTGVGSAIGIRAIDTRALTVEDCQFLFPTTADLRTLGLSGAIGAGLLLYGQCNQLAVRRNSFVGRTQAPAGAVPATIAGVAMVPALFLPEAETGGGPLVLPQVIPFDQFDHQVFDQFSNAGFLDQSVIPRSFAEVTFAEETPLPEPAAPEPAAPALQQRVNVVQDIAGGERFVVTDGTIGTEDAAPPLGGEPLPGFNLFLQPPGKFLPAVLQSGEISNNHFTGCTAAAFLCGDAGFLRIIGNDVTDAVNGFVVASTRWVSSLAFLSAFAVDQIFLGLAATTLAPLEASGKWSAVQAVAETAAAMMHPANVWMATALMSLVLPESVASRTNLATTEGLVLSGRALDPLVQQAQRYFTAGHSLLDPPLSSEQTNVTKAIGDRIRTQWGADTHPFQFLPNQSLAGIGFNTMTKRASSLVLSLQCTENVIEARTSDGRSGTAILVLDDGTSADGSAVLSGNRFSNASLPLPTAAVALVSRCTATGNLIQNAQPFLWPPVASSDALREFWSLVIIPGPRPPDRLPPRIILDDVNPLSDTGVVSEATNQAQAAQIRTANIAARFAPSEIQERLIIGGPTVDRAWLPPLVAITGNVFKGYPVLPPRWLPQSTALAPTPGDPFNTWLFVNTVSW
jgi:hypothetical protein